VAIVGRPNVGKSSLLNLIVGEKVAIVTPKPQTTRSKIIGVLTEGETQLVFIDTPGVHIPRTKLSEHMVKQARESMADVDLAVLMCEPTGPITSPELGLIEQFKALNLPAILAVNKIDTLPRKEDMLAKISAFSELYDFDEVIPISVKQNDGVALLTEKIMSYATDGPHYFDDDDYTDQPERALVAEIIREKLLRNLDEELPHGVAVSIEAMKEGPGMTEIHAVITCEKPSHKGMIIGKGGAMLKKIGTEARRDAEKLLDTKVNLQLWVKIKEDWRNIEGAMRELGYS
jgi:GTP-binding protein Era